MPVDDLAAQVAAVLSRAESLFGDCGDGPGSAVGHIDSAADAHRAIAPRTAELSGAAVTAHTEAATAAGGQIDHFAASETDLTDRLQQATEAHRGGASTAGALRAGAAEVPATLGGVIDTPTGELVALRVLRSRVARMQQLLADHSAESARLAAEIRDLGYGGQ